MVDERLVELLEAADPEVDVVGPVAGVERAAGGGDGGLGVGDGAVGSVAEHLSRRGVQRGERPLGVDQIAVDEHPAVGWLSVRRARPCPSPAIVDACVTQHSSL